MLVTLKEILETADQKGQGIGAFNCTGLESLMAITGAAEELNHPVIIQFAEGHGSLIPFDIMAPLMVEFAKKATVPICVHFDHGESFESCKKAIDAGFTGVMIDGSSLPFEENAALTAKVVEYAHQKGASVEAELGSMYASEVGAIEPGKNKDLSTEDAYTDPDQAKEFVEKTGVDALAVSFGTSHGVYLTKPELDLDRVTLIKEKTGIPLVMHGGSGLTDDEFRTAVRNGIRKINYYTYMIMEGGKAVADYVNKADDGIYFFHDMMNTATDAMKETVKKEIQVFALA